MLGEGAGVCNVHGSELYLKGLLHLLFPNILVQKSDLKNQILKNIILNKKLLMQ